MTESAEKSRKILYIVTQGNWGGAQVYVHDLATHLPPNRIPIVASGTEDGTLAEKIRKAGIPYFGLPRLLRRVSPMNDLLAIFEIASLIKKEKPDIVHLNSSKAGVLGSIAAKIFTSAKVVFTMHGLVLSEPLPFWKKTIYAAAEKIASLFRDATIAVSVADKAAALKFRLGTEKNIHIIHNGIDPETLHYLPREKSRAGLASFCGNCPASEKLVGILADFYPAKGLQYLLEAAILLKDIPNLKFLLIGRNGPDEEKLKKIITDRKLENSVFLIKGLSAGQCLPALDIFAMPSVKEGFPYALLEAAAAGLPIIASSVGGIPEFITDNINGLLTPPADSEQLASKIQKLLNDAELAKKLGENARNAAAGFSLQTMVTKTCEVYRSMQS